MPSWFVKQDYRLQGGDLATGTAPSATECDYQCWGNSMCAAWSWVAATSACELKGATGWTGAEEAGATSGVAVWASAGKGRLLLASLHPQARAMCSMQFGAALFGPLIFARICPVGDTFESN